MPSWIVGVAVTLALSLISAYGFLMLRCRGAGHPFGPHSRPWAVTVIVITAAVSTALGLAVVAASHHVVQMIGRGEPAPRVHAALQSHPSTCNAGKYDTGDLPRLTRRLQSEAENELRLLLAWAYRRGYHKLLIYPFRPPPAPHHRHRRGPPEPGPPEPGRPPASERSGTAQ